MTLYGHEVVSEKGRIEELLSDENLSIRTVMSVNGEKFENIILVQDYKNKSSADIRNDLLDQGGHLIKLLATAAYHEVEKDRKS